MSHSPDFHSLLDSIPRFNLDSPDSCRINSENSLLIEYLNFYKINFETEMENITHHFGSLDILEFDIALHYWSPKAPLGTMFILHGYWDHVGLYHHLIRFCLMNNYAVIAYDAPGHGISSGKRASIGSFQSYTRILEHIIKYTQPYITTPLFATGQSTGGAVVLDYLFTNPDNPLQCSFLLAPLIKPQKWQTIKIAYNFLHKYLKRVRRSGVTGSSHDKQFGVFLKQDPLQYHWASVDWIGAMGEWIERFSRFKSNHNQVICVQGDGDSTVDWEYNVEQITQRMPNAEVIVMADIKHHVVNETPALRNKVFAVIDRHLKSISD
ncbi:alpha/beta hydrolase [Marinibactrum halimedae]|uniref:Alpha/beta hydrolase n=1 Tax=Marinibactrum halimedae TaxID=1444977 RepID=A0AA37T556_9GAMM|nr:alpha/beta hydrolase [Marinibactrum halimedae]MCD9459350.1 alpha/beta hydrolase [Marinibactrum halimedae]GLS25756.1 alpha/beta hydrolase [Marinibactrum halimedae]